MGCPYAGLMIGWLGFWTVLPPCGSHGAAAVGAVAALPLPAMQAETAAFPVVQLPPPASAAVPAAVDPPPPVVAVRVRVPAFAGPEQEVHYDICIENCSAASAHHVIVRNPLPAHARLVRAYPEPTRKDAELQWHLGTLKGGERRQIVLVLQAIGAEDVRNCTRVQFEHGQCVTTRVARLGQVPGLAPRVPGPGQVPPGPGKLEPQPGKVAPPPGPGKITPVPKGDGKLVLDMTGPVQQYLNLPAEYFITARNAGSEPSTNVVITAALPDKTTFVSASQGGRFAAGQVAWYIPRLEAGAAHSVQLVIRAEQEGKFCVQGAALADQGLKAAAEACTVFRGRSALLVEMVDRGDPVEVGGETSYPIVIINQGSLPVHNIHVRAFVPPEMALARARGPSDNRLGERAADGAQAVLFEPLPALAPGARAEYEVFTSALRPGIVRFRVEISADELKEGGPVREEESTTIYADNGQPRGLPQ